MNIRKGRIKECVYSLRKGKTLCNNKRQKLRIGCHKSICINSMAVKITRNIRRIC